MGMTGMLGVGLAAALSAALAAELAPPSDFAAGGAVGFEQAVSNIMNATTTERCRALNIHAPEIEIIRYGEGEAGSEIDSSVWRIHEVRSK